MAITLTLQLVIKMFGSKKRLTAGDDSTNIQAEKVNVYNGISYVDAREIALQTFKDNFYELSEVARRTALERAEELVNAFLNKLKKETPEAISKIEEPDVQYSVINAQKQYARYGQKENLQILVDLLKTRFQMEEGSLKSIVLNESIEVMSKLTINQIKLITALFLVKNCKLVKARHLIEILSKIMTDDLSQFQRDISFFEHLMYAGVAVNDVTNNSSQKLEYFIRSSYSEELVKKVEGNTLDELYPPVREQFITDTLSESVFETWNNSFLSRYALTSVGKTIAVSYYNAAVGANIDLGIWIKG